MFHQKETPSGEDERQRPTLLIVEDEVIVAEDLRRRLEALGFSVAGISATGDRAIIRARQTRPDVVLMDVGVGLQRDGVETGRSIWERLQIPVVFATAYADEALPEQVRTAALFGYVFKPFDDRELKSTLDLVLFRKRTAKVVWESEKRLRRFATAAFEGIVLTDGTRVLDANSQFLTLTGYGLADVEGKEFTALIAPDCRSTLPRPGTAVPLSPLVVSLICANGTLRPVELRMRPTEEPEKPGMEIAVREAQRAAASVQPETDDALCATEDRFCRILDTARVYAVMVDGSGKIIHCNASLLTAVGRTMEDLRGKDWFTECIPADDRESCRRVFEATVARGRVPAQHSCHLQTAAASLSVSWSTTVLRTFDGEVAGVVSVGVDDPSQRWSTHSR